MDQRRQQILEAAKECFEAEGYDDTTMKRIGARAGLSIGALYTHYKNKREVVIAILKEREKWRETLKITTLAELKAFFDPIAAEVGGENRAVYNVSIHVFRAALADQELRAIMGKSLNSLNMLFTRLLSDLKKNGQIQAGYNIEAGARVISATSLGLLFWHYFDETIGIPEIRAIFNTELERMTPTP
jgi:AcrR family transcriptional regulator